MMNTLISGELHFDTVASPFDNATIHVRLLDVTHLDRESKVVGEMTLKSVSFDGKKENSLAFLIEGSSENIVDNADYIVTVHVDIENTGELSQGDYITTQSFPVLTHGYPIHVVVSLNEI